VPASISLRTQNTQILLSTKCGPTWDGTGLNSSRVLPTRAPTLLTIFNGSLTNVPSPLVQQEAHMLCNLEGKISSSDEVVGELALTVSTSNSDVSSVMALLVRERGVPSE